MQIIENLDDIPNIQNAVVTSGTFDGVHVGHKKILKHLVKTAEKIGGQSVVLTFWPHPRFVLFPNDNSLKLISTFEEKAIILEEAGIDFLVKIEFTKAFSQLSSESFIQNVIIDKLKTKKLIIGYDHHFGKNREGSFDYLKANAERFGFEVEEIKRQDIDEVGVSSTKIRLALEEGEVDHASHLIGHSYTMHGGVVEGQKIGKSIGFPTANIGLKENYKLIPKDGVYFVRVFVLNQWWNGMLNIGARPTIENASRAIEVHIIDFNEDIYGESITVDFIKRIRDEKKFESLEALKIQLEKDKVLAEALIKKEVS
ncbi:MAG: bifunctional riboflavin kinase/FAD synthetase [Reichenbachiella sp.]